MLISNAAAFVNVCFCAFVDVIAISAPSLVAVPVIAPLFVIAFFNAVNSAAFASSSEISSAVVLVELIRFPFHTPPSTKPVVKFIVNLPVNESKSFFSLNFDDSEITLFSDEISYFLYTVS